MGMFDWVNLKMKCPNCGEEINRFQTKDYDCELKTRNPLETNYFYGGCENCETWITFERKQTIGVFKDYAVTVKQECFSHDEIVLSEEEVIKLIVT
jgi:hypothetical protein